MRTIQVIFIVMATFGMLSICAASLEVVPDQKREYTLKVNDQDFDLDQAQYDQLQSFFKQYDLNSDGVIDRQEVVKLGMNLNEQDSQLPSEEEISNLIGMVDFDKDGVLNFSEFISLGFLSDEDDQQVANTDENIKTESYESNENSANTDL